MFKTKIFQRKILIAISSGKGGTGKTLISTNLARVFSRAGRRVTYLDCDVEAPNGHLFLKPDISREEEVTLLSPVGVDEGRCTRCGKCAGACTYNAIAVTPEKVLFFPELCHVCGACLIVCPEDAIVEEKKVIGLLRHGKSPASPDGGEEIDFHYALLQTGEGGMSPRLIQKVKEHEGRDITIYDSAPGTSCSAVETVSGADLVVLVTDPTPFGLNDLKLAVEMCRKIGQEPVVLVNRADYADDRLRTYCRDAELKIIGEIPDDRQVAEIYSAGGLVVDKLDRYRELFRELAEKIEAEAGRERKLKPPAGTDISEGITPEKGTPPVIGAGPRPREMVVISGKGGTGKTSLTASFAALTRELVISDCDVDAADLHLVLKPTVIKEGWFSGGVIAEIDQEACTACGRCYQECRFKAIEESAGGGGEKTYRIDPLACEGCGVCDLVCPSKAVRVKDAFNGQWFISRTRLGQPMTHARLGIAEENTGRLVTMIREKAVEEAGKSSLDRVVIDGSPGTGCPVIASLTGVVYALIVTEPTVSGVHDLKRILDVTRHFQVPAGVVINKADLNGEMAGRIKKVSADYGAEIMGEIPYDRVVTRAQVEGLSVVEFEEGPVTESIKGIWSKITAVLSA